jgi:hypothetical protein
MKQYIFNLLLGFDELANTLTGGAPSDTISGRCMRAKNDGDLWGKVLYAFLDWLQPGHCEQALINDEKGRHDQTI